MTLREYEGCQTANTQQRRANSDCVNNDNIIMIF